MSRRSLKALAMLPTLLMPWSLKRLYLRHVFGWQLHRKSRIGFSIVIADQVVLEEGAWIGHFNLVMPIGLLHLHRQASLGYYNRVVGAQGGGSYPNEPDRVSALVIEQHSAITRHHIIDCSNTVRIGSFTIFAGFRSQILTHSPDLATSSQTTRPVTIGSYCFIGTGSIVLQGSQIPDCSIVSAGSVFSGGGGPSHHIYAGNPARPVKPLPPDYDYFNRKVGRLKP
jgi:acetyltransferase-like isoleucine patch superfamily enzyme